MSALLREMQMHIAQAAFSPPTGLITRIASGWVVNSGGGFDRSASIADVGPIPAGALIVVKATAPGMDRMVITDTAGNAYEPGTAGLDISGGGTYRQSTMELHCLSALAGATNAFALDIQTSGGGGLEAYLIAVDVYTGPGTWAYVAAQSGVSELAYDTSDTVQSAAITASAKGVISGIVGNSNAAGTYASFSPGDIIVAKSTINTAGVADALSGDYIFDTAITAQRITAGVGVSGDYKYLDLLTSVFTNS